MIHCVLNCRRHRQLATADNNQLISDLLSPTVVDSPQLSPIQCL